MVESFAGDIQLPIFLSLHYDDPSQEPQSRLDVMNIASRASFTWTRLLSGKRPTSCVPSLNSILHRRYSLPVKKDGPPFRIAVLGSGPAGFYTAYQVISKIGNAVVDMYENLPVPFGLVRFGVAPDHPEVKNCQDKFTEVASLPNFNFIGNVDIGRELSLASLKNHYNAILFSYGASKDRRLGIPGEDIEGVYSARDFVGWYNGLPEHVDFVPNLDSSEEAVIVGQGNVALDVARILLTDIDQLRKTDITDQALTTLAKSKVKRVRVVGRRGPMQAAFTIKELRELLTLGDVSFDKIGSGFFPPGPTKDLPRTQRRMVDLLSKGSAVHHGQKSWSLDFLLSPTAFQSQSNRLSSVSFAKNEFIGPNIFDASAKTASTAETSSIPAGVAFRSIGYKSEPLLGMDRLGIHFDEERGLIPNDDYGRVTDQSPGTYGGNPLPGLYCSGWVKRGPAGVIANTMEDAFATAQAIVHDWQNNKPFLSGQDGWDGLKIFAEGRALQSVGWDDWLKIDAAEKEQGREKGKPREKFTTVSEMLNVLK